MFIETRIETMDTDYRSEERSVKKSIAFRRDKRNESMLLKETDDNFALN